MSECPYCGEQPRVTESSTMAGDGFQVVCGNCEAQGPMQDTKDNAVICWNDQIFLP